MATTLRAYYQAHDPAQLDAEGHVAAAGTHVPCSYCDARQAQVADHTYLNLYTPGGVIPAVDDVPGGPLAFAVCQVCVHTTLATG